MAFKEVLFQLSTYPDATPAAVIEKAASIAEIIGARISALGFEVDFVVPSNFLANALLDLPGIVAGERAKSADQVRDAVTAFTASATRRGLVHDHTIERSMIADIANLITASARLHDLTIVPTGSAEGFQRPIAEAVIFGSGRPAIVLPADGATPGFKLDTVAIAWDFGRTAARSLADALPLLPHAKNIRVVTVKDEKPIPATHSLSELGRYLSAHGVAAVLDEESANGRAIGDVLEAYVRANHVDLLVMGAYGHSRMREFILGGATRRILCDPPVPVFMSH